MTSSRFFNLAAVALIACPLLAYAESSAPTTRTSSATNPKKTAAPKTKTPPSKTAIIECDAGDSKCMESKANIETKPTDGAIKYEND